MKHRAILVLLLAIAGGLWANVLVPASAQESRGYTLQSVYGRLLAMQGDLATLKTEVDEVKSSLDEIKNGTCRNPKIC